MALKTEKQTIILKNIALKNSLFNRFINNV